MRLADEDWHYDLGRLLEVLERHGVLPIPAEHTQTPRDPNQMLIEVKRYQRALQASRRRAFDALVGAIELLRYPQVEVDHQSVSVSFRARRGGMVTAEVIDAGAGRSIVVLKVPCLRTSIVAAGSVGLLYFGVAGLAGPALWAWERRFAAGFLDNVQAVLEGRQIGKDSSLLLGVHEWPNRKHEL
jgi:hypothetical protein